MQRERTLVGWQECGWLQAKLQHPARQSQKRLKWLASNIPQQWHNESPNKVTTPFFHNWSTYGKDSLRHRHTRTQHSSKAFFPPHYRTMVTVWRALTWRILSVFLFLHAHLWTKWAVLLTTCEQDVYKCFAKIGCEIAVENETDPKESNFKGGPKFARTNRLGIVLTIINDARKSGHFMRNGHPSIPSRYFFNICAFLL